MKKISNYLCYIAILALVFTSCSKEEAPDSLTPQGDKAVLTLGALLTDALNDANKQSLPECSGTDPAYADISVSYDSDGDGDADDSDEVIEVTVEIGLDSQGYFTLYDEELEIPIPNGGTTVDIRLNDFFIYNNVPDPLVPGSDRTLIWMAPKEGSDFAQFVNDPLPMFFDLRAGTKNYQDVEVLCFDNREVNRFGYQFFDIIPTPMIEFCIFGNYCTPSGRHYPAEYSVSVWSGTDTSGTPFYTNVENFTDTENGEFYAEPLCFALPDTEGLDEYYFEITLRSSDEYGTVNERVIRQGVINDDIVRAFFDGDDNLDYYHFIEGEGCENEDDTPIFEDPESEWEYYKTCAYPLNDSNSIALTYLEVKGNVLKATVLAAGVTPDKPHLQHLHGFDDGTNSVCPPMEADEDDDGFISIGEGLPFYGGVQLALDYEDESFPMANSYGMYTYHRTFDLSGMDLPSWEDLSVVVHGRMVGNDYVATLPVACGEISNLD